jgi:hypothetical protein
VNARFNTMTTKCLTEAGWRPGRRIPVAPEVETELRAHGHQLLPSARKFVEEFGGLAVVHPHFKVAGSLDNFVIDPLLATKGRDAGWVREYERRTRESALTPIGEASRGYLIMCMGQEGAVYGGYDNILVRLGASGEEALEALCTGKESLQIE